MKDALFTFLVDIEPPSQLSERLPGEDYIDPAYVPAKKPSSLRDRLLPLDHSREDTVFNALQLIKIYQSTSFAGTVRSFMVDTIFPLLSLIQETTRYQTPTVMADDVAVAGQFNVRREGAPASVFSYHTSVVRVDGSEVTVTYGDDHTSVTHIPASEAASVGPIPVSRDSAYQATLSTEPNLYKVLIADIPKNPTLLLAERLTKSHISRDHVSQAAAILTESYTQALLDTVNKHPITTNRLGAATLLLAADTYAAYKSL